MADDIEKRDDFEDDTQHKPQPINFDDIPDIMPLLPVRDVVIYSYMILPLMVGREKSIRAVEQAVSGNRLIFLATQKLSTDEDPESGEIYSLGTVAMVVKMLKLPDGRVKILVQGVAKGRIVSYLSSANYFMVQIEKIQEPAVEGVTIEIEALMRTVKENSEKILQLRGIVSPDAVAILDSIEDPGRLADLVASNLKLRVEESQQILEIIDPVPRLKKVNELLSKELELSAMQAKIQTQAKEEMGKTHESISCVSNSKRFRASLEKLMTKQRKLKNSRPR